MTPQPQQEYIISEEMVQCIEAWTGRYPTASKDIVETIRSHPHTPNPCEEQGCTDIHDCDEICEHQRMYTPAWVKQHDKAIRKAERERVLGELSIFHSDNWCEIGLEERTAWYKKIESLRGEP